MTVTVENNAFVADINHFQKKKKKSLVLKIQLLTHKKKIAVATYRMANMDIII